MALRGKKKAEFIARMKRGRAAAARRRKGPARKRTARKKSTTRRAPARRSTSRRRPPAKKAPTRRRPRKKPEGVLAGLVKTAVPHVLGIVIAGVVARAVKPANTPIKRAAVTTAVALGLSTWSNFLARNVPLGVVTPTFVRNMAAGVAIDSVFRGSTGLRANIQQLPSAAQRPGGILAGNFRRPRVAASEAGVSRMAGLYRLTA